MERLTNNTVSMLIIGLVFILAAHAAKQPAFDSSSSEIEMNEFSLSGDNIIDDKQMNGDNDNSDEQMPVNDQISALSRQIKKLTERRQEDYRILERSLHSYVQKHYEEYINADIKKELKDLR
jgi:hypothetical protein